MAQFIFKHAGGAKTSKVGDTKDDKDKKLPKEEAKEETKKDTTVSKEKKAKPIATEKEETDKVKQEEAKKLAEEEAKRVAEQKELARGNFKWEGVGDYYFDDLATLASRTLNMHLRGSGFTNKRAASFRTHVADMLDGISKGEIYKDAGGRYIDKTGKRFSTGSFDTTVFGTPKVNSNTSYNDAAYFIDSIIPMMQTKEQAKEAALNKAKGSDNKSGIGFIDRSGEAQKAQKEIDKGVEDGNHTDVDSLSEGSTDINAGDDGLSAMPFDMSRVKFNWFTNDSNKLIEYETEKGTKYINDFTKESPIYHGLNQLYDETYRNLEDSAFGENDFRFKGLSDSFKYDSALDMTRLLSNAKDSNYSVYRLFDRTNRDSSPMFALYETKWGDDKTMRQRPHSKAIYGSIGLDEKGNYIFNKKDAKEGEAPISLGTYNEGVNPAFVNYIDLNKLDDPNVYNYIKNNYEDFMYESLYNDDNKEFKDNLVKSLHKYRGSLQTHNAVSDERGDPQGFRSNKDNTFNHRVDIGRKNAPIYSSENYRGRRYKWHNPANQNGEDYVWIYELNAPNADTVENAKYEIIPQGIDNYNFRKKNIKFKDGGKVMIIKAQTGAVIGNAMGSQQSPESPETDNTADTEGTTNKIINYTGGFEKAATYDNEELYGLDKGFQGKDPAYSGVVDLFGTSDMTHRGSQFSGSTKLRTAAAITDLLSVAVAFSPLSPAAALAGLGSTSMTTAADIQDVKDGKMTSGAAFVNTATNLGLDALSIIPGLKSLKAAKAVKTLLPLAMTAVDVMGITDPATRESYSNTFKKIGKLNFKELTGDDVSNLTRLSRALLTGKNMISNSNYNYNRREDVHGDQYKYSAEVDGKKHDFFIKASTSTDGKFTSKRLIDNTKKVIGVGPDSDVKITITSDTSKPLTFVNQGAAEYERRRLARLFRINKTDDAGRGYKKMASEDPTYTNKNMIGDTPKKWTEGWLMREVDHAVDEDRLKLPKLPKLWKPKEAIAKLRHRTSTSSKDWVDGKYVRDKTKSQKSDIKSGVEEVLPRKTFTPERRSTIKGRLHSQKAIDEHDMKFQEVMNYYFGSGKKEGKVFKHDGKELTQREANHLLSNNINILGSQYKKVNKAIADAKPKPKANTKTESKTETKTESTNQAQAEVKTKSNKSSVENAMETKADAEKKTSDFKKASEYAKKGLKKTYNKAKEKVKNTLVSKKNKEKVSKKQQGGILKSLNNYGAKSFGGFNQDEFRRILENDLKSSISKYGKEEVMNAFNSIEKSHADYDKLSGNTQSKNVFGTNANYVPQIQSNYQKYFSGADNYLRSNLSGYGTTEGSDKIDNHYGDRTLRRRVFTDNAGKGWFNKMNILNGWNFNVNDLQGYDNGDNYYQLSLNKPSLGNLAPSANLNKKLDPIKTPKYHSNLTNTLDVFKPSFDKGSLSGMKLNPIDTKTGTILNTDGTKGDGNSSVLAGYLNKMNNIDVNPADILATGKWARGKQVNNRAFKHYYNSMKPTYVNSPEYSSAVHGNFTAKQAANNSKGQLYHLASTPSTSDSRVHLNNQLNAANKGVSFEMNAAMQDADMFNKTRDVNNQLALKSHAGRVEAANLNRKNGIAMQMAKAREKASHDIAQYTQMDAPFLSGIENRMRTNQKMADYYNVKGNEMQINEFYSPYIKPLSDRISDKTATPQDEAMYSYYMNKKGKELLESRKKYSMDPIFGRRSDTNFYQQGGKLTASERAALNQAKDFNKSLLQDNKEFLKSVNNTKKLNSDVLKSMSTLTALLIKDAMSIK